jgi:hypothetical protein
MALPDGLAGTYAGTSEGKAGVKILGLYQGCGTRQRSPWFLGENTVSLTSG